MTPARTAPLKLLGTLATLTLVGVLGVAGTTSALSDTTDSGGNAFDAGEIVLADNDGGAFMYDVDNQEPGDVVEKCIRVSYTGTTESLVTLYLGSSIGSVGKYVEMTLEAGTQSAVVFPNCTGFTSTASLYTGTLAGFHTDHGTEADGIVHGPDGVDTAFASGESVVYKVRLELSDDPRQPGENFSGAHTYTWRAETS